MALFDLSFTRQKWKWFAVCVLSIGVILLLHKQFFPLVKQLATVENLERLQAYVIAMGFWGPLICMVLYVVCTVFFIPTTPVSILVGVTYGALYGTLYCAVGTSIGASCSFFIARYVMRPWVSRKLAHTHLFKKIDEGVKKDGWRIIIFSRMFPVNPYHLLNYAYGITRVRYPTYIVASVAGLLIPTGCMIWMASAAGELIEGKRDFKVFLLLLVGSIAFLGISYLPRFFKRPN